ncbi:MAG: hypothetical protein JWR51_4688 [Devosia sp.]|uniref:hypothetical protein n=1 Tax=Devosia sp. TaxID=1871048 RepID=UPI002631B141|nr:hypothetical protein [Devosia sp.]MDB5531585.1 hypothetical protein [Devosia sp.]
MNEAHEMTLEQFVRSKWFIAAARTMAIVGGTAVTMGGGFVTWAVLDTKAQSAAAVAAVSRVEVVQDQRADKGDDFQTGITMRVDRLEDKVDSANYSLAKIEGIVSQIAGRAEPKPAAWATTDPLP